MVKKRPRRLLTLNIEEKEPEPIKENIRGASASILPSAVRNHSSIKMPNFKIRAPGLDSQKKIDVNKNNIRLIL